MARKTTMIAVNDIGRRIGESHHRAKHSDELIDLVRALREPSDRADGGTDPGLTYDQIAEKLDLSKSTVARICRCEIRAQTAAAFKRAAIRRLERSGVHETTEEAEH
ncbi:MAG: winged helix-turn-helix transcriptional regulator [bacterium]|nr:winged helix-turn-helix transcriptional regulator [bacterium]